MTGIAIAGAGVSLIGTGVQAGTGAAASSKATKAQKEIAEMQMRNLREIYGLTQTQAQQYYNQYNQSMQPYMKQGAYGAKRERAMADMYAQKLPEWMKPYGMAEYEQSPLYTPMARNLAELQATPGYQFELQQGQQALAQTAAARGGLLSGAQQRAAGNYAQKQAATGFQNAWQRAQQAYQAAFAQDQSSKAQQAGMVSGGAGLYGGMATRGAGAAQAVGQSGVGMALDLGRLGAGIAGEQNQAMQGYGDARSANAYGQAGAINQGVQGLLGAGLSIYDRYRTGGSGAGGFSGPYGPNN
jgi:hypothetical protein